jgi:hypothetical protein
MPHDTLVNQPLTDRQIHDLNDRLDNVLAASLGLDYPQGLPVSEWLLLSDDPVLEAGAFYSRLKNESLFEFCGELNAPQKLYVLEELIKRGINVIDWLLQSVQSPFFGLSQINQHAPGVRLEVPSNRGDQPEAFARYQVCFDVLDTLWQKALLEPCFAPDLDNRRGLPRVYSNQHLGVPLNDPRARLFAMVITDHENLTYVAHSPLMRHCMAHFFAELSGQQSSYPRHALVYFVEAFSSLPKDGVFEQSKPALLELYREMAKGFARLEFAGEAVPELVAPSLTSSLMAQPGLRGEPLQMSREQHLEVATNILRTRVFQAAYPVMQVLFDDPDAFSTALAASESSEEMARMLFAHCLGVSLLAKGKAVNEYELMALIDQHRNALQARGYSEIKGTQAMDPLAINLDIAEIFMKAQYLRREEMHLGGLFCRFPYTSRQPMKGKVDPLTYGKTELASELKQIETLKQAALCFLNPLDNISFNHDLVSAYTVQLLLVYKHVQPSELIDRPWIFEKILKMGFMSAEQLLEDPALAQYAYIGLEQDLGL